NIPAIIKKERQRKLLIMAKIKKTISKDWLIIVSTNMPYGFCFKADAAKIGVNSDSIVPSVTFCLVKPD
ncbi:MAG: hypothetical protein QM669_15975, partial [Siphonobacter sp.]